MEEEMRPGYRGRCLYKTGKCMNERAIKTSGAPHNLCDEHRNRQNEHQRKLDAKNRHTRKDKRSVSKTTPIASASTTTPPEGVANKSRYSPYKRQSKQPGGVEESSDTDSNGNGSNAAVAPSVTQMAPVLLANTISPLHGLAHHSAAAMPGTAAVPVSTSQVLEGVPSGMVYLPNGPQPPQMAYPFVMQDFDGIVVPLPSYLEGQERIEFRARIYQKVLDFISEECILRYGVKGGAQSVQQNNVAAVADTNISSNGNQSHAGNRTLTTASRSANASATGGTTAESSPGSDDQTLKESTVC